MRKFIRQKADGFIMGFNETLAADHNFEVFETAITPVPAYIPDLGEFLEPEKKAARKTKKTADEGGVE